jgi:hypothetical protein
MTQTIPIKHTPTRLRVLQHRRYLRQYINHILTLAPPRLTIVLVVPSVDRHTQSRRHVTTPQNVSDPNIFSDQVL